MIEIPSSTGVNRRVATAGGGRGFRKLKTSRGDYFVRWSPDHVAELLCSEALRPEEFVTTDRGRRQRLVKDLFLLGLQDELGQGGPSVITGYARALMAGVG